MLFETRIPGIHNNYSHYPPLIQNKSRLSLIMTSNRSGYTLSTLLLHSFCNISIFYHAHFLKPQHHELWNFKHGHGHLMSLIVTIMCNVHCGVTASTPPRSFARNLLCDDTELSASFPINSLSVSMKTRSATRKRNADELQTPENGDQGVEPELKIQSNDLKTAKSEPRRKMQKQKEVEDEDEESSKKPKRVKRKGCLQDMPNMPLDILFEIFSQMHPQDLLFLSRTTKAFRQLLTSKYSVIYWKGSFKNVSEPLPPIFPGMNELQFANLLFSPHCHRCANASIHVQTVLWEFRARYCTKCKNSVLVDASDVHKGTCKRGELPHIPKRGRYVELEYLTTIRYRWKGRLRDVYFHSVEIKTLNKEWKDIDLGDEQAWASIRQERAKYLRENAHVAKLCEAWYEKKKSTRLVELEKLRTERFSAIIEKVREIGYGVELGKYTESIRRTLAQEKSVREPKLLTDRGWKSLEPLITEIMNTFRETRLKEEHQAALQLRMQPLEAILLTMRIEYGDTNFPAPADFMCIPRIRKIVDIPTDESLTPEDFVSAVEPILPQVLSEWKASVTKRLVEAIESKCQVPKGTDPFTLAIGQFFYCKDCGCRSSSEARAYPNICAHSCFYSSHKSDLDTYGSALKEAFTNTSSLNLDQIESAADLVHDIIAGTNSQATDRITPTKLDEMNLLFGCESCDKNNPVVRPIMTWRALLKHLGSEKCRHSLRLAEEGEIKLVSTLNETVYGGYERFTCRHCAELPFFVPKSEISQHLNKKHEIDVAALTESDIEEHVVQSSDVPVVVQEPRWLISRRERGDDKIMYCREWQLLTNGQGVVCDFEQLYKKSSRSKEHNT
ncbi:hypothetical protein ABKN59_003464 [Abortiporus biennis]